MACFAPLHMFSLPFYGSLLTDEQQVNNSRSKENNLPHEHHTSAKERFSSTTVPWKRKKFTGNGKTQPNPEEPYGFLLNTPSVV
jgi:hypothetical protein